jgi:hypothetical protein
VREEGEGKKGKREVRGMSEKCKGKRDAREFFM